MNPYIEGKLNAHKTMVCTFRHAPIVRLAASRPVTAQVTWQYRTFDGPAASTYYLPYGINNAGTIVGTYVDRPVPALSSRRAITTRRSATPIRS